MDERPAAGRPSFWKQSVTRTKIIGNRIYGVIGNRKTHGVVGNQDTQGITC
jgi:hypothetical protein